jgi:nucleotide-binding universal stress UspA family protein
MIELKKILLPTDFSETSLEALKYAISLSTEYGAELTILHVINEQLVTEGLSLPRIVSMDEIEKEMHREAARQMKDFLAGAGELSGVTHRTVTLSGNPFLEIIRYAKDNQIDLIVIGTHGRSGFEHILFGSTAERVVRKAPCPVLSVKPAQREFVLP